MHQSDGRTIEERRREIEAQFAEYEKASAEYLVWLASYRERKRGFRCVSRENAA